MLSFAAQLLQIAGHINRIARVTQNTFRQHGKGPRKGFATPDRLSNEPLRKVELFLQLSSNAGRYRLEDRTSYGLTRHRNNLPDYNGDKATKPDYRVSTP